jgi:hypothetical protein
MILKVFFRKKMFMTKYSLLKKRMLPFEDVLPAKKENQHPI